MKMLKKLLTVLLTGALLLGLSMTAFAAEEYSYTVTFYAGNQGSFNGAGITASGGSVSTSSDKIVISGLKLGDVVGFNAQSGVSLGDSSKYYIQGIRLSGRDNDTVAASVFTVSEDADYVYICENNTIYGTKFKELPNTKGKILVSDVSSCFLSEPVDVSKYGIIYGGVQKNIGPAGVVIVIIREDLITEDVLPGTPTMLQYKIHADAESLYNTPPAYGIYICGKVFKWLKEMGAIKEYNEKKAKILYDFLDESKLFKGTVEKKDRSLMNVPFVTGDAELDAKFVKEAKEAGFENLKGHRSVGGMRASIYNAMPIEGVEALVAFMKKFEEANL